LSGCQSLGHHHLVCFGLQQGCLLVSQRNRRTLIRVTFYSHSSTNTHTQGPQACTHTRTQPSPLQTLYLSKNALRSLDGVQAFPALTALSAADNLLADFACIQPLSQHAQQQAQHGQQRRGLEALSLEGNPVAALPHYRAHVIAAVGPSLQWLDGRAVTPEERRAAGDVVAQEAQLLRCMVGNACLVHALGRAVQVAQLHGELLGRAVGLPHDMGSASRGEEGGGAGDESMSQRVKRLLGLWDYERRLGAEEAAAIAFALRREVARRHCKIILAPPHPTSGSGGSHRSNHGSGAGGGAGARAEGAGGGAGKSWQRAFAQVMMTQQEAIARLLARLDQCTTGAAGKARGAGSQEGHEACQQPPAEPSSPLLSAGGMAAPCDRWAAAMRCTTGIECLTPWKCVCVCGWVGVGGFKG
jgi:hypothetical protein